MRLNILNLKIPRKKSDVSEYVSASFGVLTIIPPTSLNFSETLEQVDRMLCKAKEAGCNRIVSAIHWPPIDEKSTGHPIFSRNSGKQRELCTNTFHSLVKEFVEHCESGELILTIIGYEGAADHIAEHDALKQKAAAILENFQEALKNNGEEAIQFVTYGIVMKHLETSDRLYFPLARKIAHGAL